MLPPLSFRRTLVASSLLLALAAHAEDVRQRFELPAGALTPSVNALARQANVQILFAGPLADGLRGQAVHGEFSPEQALTQLLQGTGLRFRRQDQRTFIIEPGRKAGEDPTLASVVVTGNSIPAFRTASVRSATKTESRAIDLAQSVAVVEQELIREQRVIRMEDALRNVAGVYSGQTEGRRDQFTIRGFSAELDTYVDGVRDTAGYRDFSNIERVEVLKGPAAMLFGRGSAGGIINRISKKPVADPVREVQLTIGSDDFKRGEWDLAGALAPGANFRLTGAHEEGGMFRNAIKHELSTLAAAADFKLGERTSLLAQAEWQQVERTPDRGIPSLNRRPADVDRKNFYGSPHDYANREHFGISTTLEHAVSDATQLRAVFRFNQMELDAQNTRNIGLANNNTEVRRQALRFPKEKEFAFTQLELIHKLKTAGIEHQLLAGYEHGWQQGRLQVWRKAAGNVSLNNPNDLAVAPLFTAADKTFDTRFEATTDAFYLQDQMQLSPEWKAIAGVRYDIFRQRQAAGLLNGQPGNALERIDRAWSPRLGIIYQPLPQHSIYLSSARSFQPKAEDLLWASAADMAQKPTQTVQYEIGNKNEFFNGRLGLNFALYEITMSNVATSDPANPGQLIQVGEQRHRGAEIDFSGELGDGWRVYGGASWIDAAVTRSNDPALALGSRPLNIPKQSANLWLSKSFLERWRAGIGIYHLGERYAFSDNTVRLPAYTRLDAALSYRWKGTEFALNLRNLSDQRYYDSATNNNQIAPGIPRTAMLTARFSF